MSSTSISLTWAPPELGSRNGVIFSYHVTVSQSLLLVTTTERITIDGLQPFTNYEIRVAAHTVATGPFSAPLQVMTGIDGESCDSHVV